MSGKSELGFKKIPMKYLMAWISLSVLSVIMNRSMAADGKLLAGTAKVNLTPDSDEPLHDSIYARSLGPGYVADVRSAALGGYGADQDPKIIEVGAGEAMVTRQLENYYRLNGLMRKKPGPFGFKSGHQWIIVPFQNNK
jgi:hypothetical protein